MIMDMIPAWFLRTAASTGDTLCGGGGGGGTFAAASSTDHRRHQNQPQHSSTFCLPSQIRSRSTSRIRSTSGSRKKQHDGKRRAFYRNHSPPSSPPYRERTLDDNDDGGEDETKHEEDDDEEEENLICRKGSNPLCMAELWRDLDSLSAAPDGQSVPREVVVDQGRQSPVSHLFGEHHEQEDAGLLLPRPLSRTAPQPLAPHLPAAIATSRPILSLLGDNESTSRILEEEEEEEDSLLLGLEHTSVQKSSGSSSSPHSKPTPIPPVAMISPDTQASNDQASSLGFSVSSSQLWSPPVIQRKEPPPPQRPHPIRPKYRDTFEPPETNNGTAFLSEIIGLEEGCDRQDDNVSEDPLPRIQDAVLPSSSRRIMPALPGATTAWAAHRDPPDDPEIASTALFTYSTQDSSAFRTTSLALAEEEGVETVMDHPAFDSRTNVSSAVYRHKFLDGASYSTFYQEDLEDAGDNHGSGYNDADILHAASTVKSMLLSKHPQFRYISGGGSSEFQSPPPTSTKSTKKKPLQYPRGHWFLAPSSYSQTSISRLSTPSHSPLSSPCQSMEEEI